MSNAQENYRPDIDGLRAVAVLSVVIHHLAPNALPGGYAGVDIFFVISGYLITSHILSELQRGNFSFLEFYRRRVNRILPALYLVIASGLLLGVFVLSPTDFERLANSALFAGTGLSNIYFWREYGNYFLPDTGEAVLLHTWSLGVEEQFYLLWPLFFAIAFRWLRQHLFGALAIATLLAVLLSEFATHYFVSASYYLLPTRMFELMLGGVLAVWAARPLERSVSEALLKVGEVLGLLGLVVSFLWLDKATPYPGIYGLIPCGAATLLIMLGNLGRPCRLLQYRPAVWVGLISYSLYLWHWPMIAYLNYLGVHIDLGIGVVVLCLSIGLAFLSWRYVETPFRRNGMALPLSRVFAIRLMLPLVLLLGVLVVTKQYAGFPGRFDPLVSKLEGMAAQRPNELRQGCHVPNALYRTPINHSCILGREDGDSDGILIGDSYANHFSGMVDVLAKAGGVKVTDYTMDGCPPILGYGGMNPPAYAERCLLRNEAIYRDIEQQRYRFVILAASWPTDVALEKLAGSIETIEKSGARAVIILSNQSIPKGATCPVRQLIFAKDMNCSVDQSARVPYWQALQKNFPEARFIDPDMVICAHNRCSPMLADTLLYRDSGHLNDLGSRLIGIKLLKTGAASLQDIELNHGTR